MGLLDVVRDVVVGICKLVQKKVKEAEEYRENFYDLSDEQLKEKLRGPLPQQAAARSILESRGYKFND